ncbi:MAG TPA: type II toxin-antitoxin system RelE/ParE family toxin [Bacteroidales bacterium]|nr:type II toxin-antitoxin system RelE/ParE family toxin [Bacteroidales bacterium]HRZ49269.1 type II toxin-antitoxin system RelE/ParE family toxin [Bacteroidales bacterium]
MKEEKFIREVVYYRRYYLDFFDSLSPEVKLKFNWTLKLIATVDRIPVKFFNHVTSTEGIYEIRVDVKRTIYRVFCFFDDGRLIILMNGFQKKTSKTPRKEIELAERIKKQYNNEKY